MSDPLQLSPNTIARLQKHAKPFVDTVDTVINRILNIYEENSNQDSNDEADFGTAKKIRDFLITSPPDLTHTKVLSVEFNNRKFPRSDTTWNALLNEAICIAKKKAKSEDELRRLILVNYVKGKKEDEGYHYLPDANLSVQGQDANAAWRATYHIIDQLSCTFEVIFAWRMKEGASHPGTTGRFARKTRLHYVS